MDLLKTPYGGFNEKPLHQAFTGAIPFGLGLVTRGSLPVASQSSSEMMKLFQVREEKSCDVSNAVQTVLELTNTIHRYIVK